MKLFSVNRTPVVDERESHRLSGWLSDFSPAGLQSRGSMEILGLAPAADGDNADTATASPAASLKLVQVPDYGTMVLRNTDPKQVLIVPMHIGFFQHGAQNHATSRTLIFGPGEERQIGDCFCIQAAQGGLLKQADQRFLMLPAGLRGSAMGKRHVSDIGRLWDDIDSFTRGFGVARGGHLERFLRPNFRRLQPFRHAFEATGDQVGGAYYVDGQLIGLEISPSAAAFADMHPVLSIYCYGPAALLADRQGSGSSRVAVDLAELTDIADLSNRLQTARRTQRDDRLRQLSELLNAKWKSKSDEHRHGYRVSTVQSTGWIGQTVHRGQRLTSLSVFRA